MSRCYICNKKLESHEIGEDKLGTLPCGMCRTAIRDTVEQFDIEEEVIRLSDHDYEIFLEATEGRGSKDNEG